VDGPPFRWRLLAAIACLLFEDRFSGTLTLLGEPLDVFSQEGCIEHFTQIIDFVAAV
jgi:hypothetical protein